VSNLSSSPPTSSETAPRHNGASVDANHQLLIIRFSSFGDIIQASAVPGAFRRAFSSSSVHWLVRSDFKDLLSGHPLIDTIIPFERAQGIAGLIKLAWKLASSRRYTHVYDAHNNLRSNLFTFAFFFRAALGRLSGGKSPRFARRSKDRLRRWLFFRFRLPVLPRPFRGAESFHTPLRKWGIDQHVPQGAQFWAQATLPLSVLRDFKQLPSPLIAAAPSAAWAMKRWPVSHWKTLVSLLPNAGFIFLGGPDDKFISEIAAVAPERTVNLAGVLNLAQSIAVLPFADLVIAGDTGLLHAADQMERPTLALIGPTAFGYPSHSTSETLEIELYCKPCSKDGRGKCVNEVYQRCLIDLSPAKVAKAAENILARSSPLSPPTASVETSS
jgi:ADP-heptose:LPS heptosyltransferase